MSDLLQVRNSGQSSSAFSEWIPDKGILMCFLISLSPIRHKNLQCIEQVQLFIILIKTF